VIQKSGSKQNGAAMLAVPLRGYIYRSAGNVELTFACYLTIACHSGFPRLS
jgi:hypothetical protein